MRRGWGNASRPPRRCPSGKLNRPERRAKPRRRHATGSARFRWPLPRLPKRSAPFAKPPQHFRTPRARLPCPPPRVSMPHKHQRRPLRRRQWPRTRFRLRRGGLLAAGLGEAAAQLAASSVEKRRRVSFANIGGGNFHQSAAPTAAKNALQPHVDGLTFQSQDTKHALVNAVERLVLNESLQAFQAERELAHRQGLLRLQSTLT